jgi:hypothetical protein
MSPARCILLRHRFSLRFDSVHVLYTARPAAPFTKKPRPAPSYVHTALLGDCDPANGTPANVSLQVSKFNNAALDAAHTGLVTIDPSSLSFTQCTVK